MKKVILNNYEYRQLKDESREGQHNGGKISKDYHNFQTEKHSQSQWNLKALKDQYIIRCST